VFGAKVTHRTARHAKRALPRGSRRCRCVMLPRDNKVMANETQLKQKYQPAIDLMKQSGIRLDHVHMQGDKLYIQGKAPSQEIKNSAWDQIKRLDPGFSDLTCDLTVDTSLPQPGQSQQSPPSMSAGASASGGQGRRYTVKSGDTLSKIAKEFYGRADQYTRIFEANRNVLTDPDKIRSGQELVIPE
jgi:hypothetical protein